ncbi:MAG: cytochrome c oxidase assembly protein [Gemmatimonadota bacterium]|nr:cytochrome c oxidase assembly protein [Gemmatimonadota bacterium]
MTWWCAATDLPWTWTWRAYPGVWLFVAAVVGGYAWALIRLQPARLAGDDQPTTRKEIALFVLGALTLWAATDWPVGALAAGYLLSARTLQYLLYVLVAPPLLLLGTPRWLLRRLLRGRVAFRLARVLSRPLVPLLVYNAVLIAVHLPPVVNAVAGSQLLSFGLDLLVIASGLVFWWPALGRLPELRPMGYPGRLGYLLLSVFVPTVPAAFYTYARFPIYELYELAPRVQRIAAVADQQIAGLMMKTLGGLILFGTMSVMFFRWHRQEERQEIPQKEPVA